MIKLSTQQIHLEHDKYKEEMLIRLTKSYENSISNLSNDSENIQEYLDIVNDLGHEF